jgi:hypothetical protein
MTVFIFKLVYTDVSHQYDIPQHWTVKYTFLRIRDYIVEDFDINNAFEIVDVNHIPDSNNKPSEECDCLSPTFLDLPHRITEHFYKRRDNVFYIRPIERYNYEETNSSIQRV